MLALYRSGRQAEALEAFQDARRALTDELGIEPSQQLRELQQAILRQDSSVERGPAVGALTAASTFVGREREVETLRTALDDAINGPRATCPSRRRARHRQESTRRGGTASRASAQGTGSCRALLGGRRGSSVLALGSGVARVHPRLPPGTPSSTTWPWRSGTRAAAPGAPRTHSGSPRAFRTRFRRSTPSPFRCRRDALEKHCPRPATRSVLRRRPCGGRVIVASPPIPARELAHARLLVLAAYRDVDPTLRDPLRTTLSELVREPVTRRISLVGLVHDEIADYISMVARVEPEARAVAEIHAETAGNALFVGEIVRLLAAQGKLDAAGGSLEIPAGIREVIGSRVARLTEPCRKLLSIASVLGREFGVEVLQYLSDLPGETLYDALDEAMSERIIGDVPGAHNRLRFAHVLIRDTLYDDLTAARRMQRHREAAVALERAYGSELGPHLAEIALHFVAAVLESTDSALDYARRAASQAASSLAFEEAARLYNLALTLPMSDANRCEVFLTLGDVLARAGDTPASKRHFDQAAQLAEKLGLAEQLGHAALGYGGRIVWEVSRDDDHLIPLLERALDELAMDDSVLRVRLLARLAGPLRDARFAPERRPPPRARRLRWHVG